MMFGIQRTFSKDTLPRKINMDPGINTDGDKDVADIVKKNAEESEKKPTLELWWCKQREMEIAGRGEQAPVSLCPHSTAW